MSMVVKNNMSAVSVLNTLNKNSSALGKNLEHVATGMKLNSAADDNSGYAISERMRVQIRSLDQANQNTQNGSSMMKVAEGAVSSTVDLLKTLKEKVINAANDTNTDSDRQTIQKELDQSIDQINDNANITFNGKYLIDGSKNEIGKATYTSLTNQSLSTATTGGSALTTLQDRTGNGLGILSSDNVTVSYVQDGKTYSTTYSVGTSSLQQIFVKAEAIDDRTYTFGDKTNESVSKATGLDPSALLARRDALRTDLDNKIAALGAAETAYNSALSAYNTAKGTVDTALATLGSYATSSGVQTQLGVNYSAFYGSFVSWTGSANYPDPSLVGTTGSYTLLNAGNSGIASGAGFGNSDCIAYTNAWSTYSGSSGYSAYQNALTALGSAASALTTAQNDKTNAQNLYDAEFGPAVIDNAKVGMSKSGDAVETLNGENGITVVAASSGVNGQISGLTISITDSDGKIKQSANAVLDAFSETIRAENASDDNAMVIQVGTKANQAIKLGLSDMRAEALGLKGSDGTTLNISTQTKANAAINVLDNAIQKALDQQVKIGATNYRFEFTSKNLNTASENVQASESTYRDADMAREMADYTKNNVLLQASQAMLAQANQNSSDVLMLLR